MTTFTTCSRICRLWPSRPTLQRRRDALQRRRLLAAAGPFALALSLYAQSIDPSMLLNPPKDSWPTYHGDYSGRRHSALTQITPDNVKQLALEWVFQTGRTDQLKASPVVVNGVIYLTSPDQIGRASCRERV